MKKQEITFPAREDYPLSYDLDGRSVKVHHFADIKHNLIPQEESTILIGNGFNMSIGIQTSYLQLGRELKEINKVKQDIPKKVWRKLDEERDIDLEDFTSSLKHCREFVRREIFRLIIEKSGVRLKNKREIMSFLADFQLVFTTNYDPVLYHLLVSLRELSDAKRIVQDKDPMLIHSIENGKNHGISKEIKEKSIFLRNIDILNKGLIVVGKREIAISSLPSSLANSLVSYLAGTGTQALFSASELKQVFEAFPHMLKEVDSVEPGDFIDIVRKPRLKKRDGFAPEGKRLVWRSHNPQEFFYLHGAFHLYKEKELIHKLTKEEIKSLYEILVKEKKPDFSIFQRDRKLRRIYANDYLKHCYKQLKEITGPVCALGWKCHAGDIHLAQAINSSGFKKIFASLYMRHGEEGLVLVPDKEKEPGKTMRNYFSRFPREKLQFFDISTVDYLG